MNSPLISIVIAVFNGAKTLQQCIDSVAQQTYANKELIIIDGGSNDGTVELLKANNGHISYWVSEPDTGIYNAWNKALVQVKGEWICFLGSDDFFWDKHVLKKTSKHLIAMPSNTRVVYGKVMFLGAAEESLYSIGKPWKKVKKSFNQMMTIPHSSTLHHARLFAEHGNFNESFRIAGDYEFLLRELPQKDAFFMSDLVTIGMRQGGISSTPKNILLSLQEVRRAQKLNHKPVLRLKWLLAIVKAYIRLFLWTLLGEKLTKKILDLGRSVIGLAPYWTKI